MKHTNNCINNIIRLNYYVAIKNPFLVLKYSIKQQNMK